jgi:hypothetical protein
MAAEIFIYSFTVYLICLYFDTLHFDAQFRLYIPICFEITLILLKIIQLHDETSSLYVWGICFRYYSSSSISICMSNYHWFNWKDNQMVALAFTLLTISFCISLYIIKHVSFLGRNLYTLFFVISWSVSTLMAYYTPVFAIINLIGWIPFQLYYIKEYLYESITQ